MQSEVRAEEFHYLIFQLGPEVFGTPILKVREVIRPSAIEPVPFTVPHFKGVLNLRGKIVSIVDFRIKLGLPAKESGLVLVIEAGSGWVGALVDAVREVRVIPREQIDAHPAFQSRVPREFFLGLARDSNGKELVNLVDLAACLSDEDLKEVHRKERAA
jgi:purine-binding chemotaxis protein CheW